MRIKPISDNFIMPTKGSNDAAAIDLYMPESGCVSGVEKKIPLGFAAAIPKGYVGLLLPRSGVGAKHGLELNNTCGVIDADYRGEWVAVMRTKSGNEFCWQAKDRVLQCVLVPVLSPTLEQVEDLDATDRGEGGFGSSGK